MKKYALKKTNNKGIALISILIAVAFLSIIGSALLYITYANFQMKVMNIGSKTNFYETDGELVNASTVIRNYAQDPTSADLIVTKDAAYPSAGHPSEYVYDVSNAFSFAGLDASGSYVIDGDTFTVSMTGNASKTTSGSLTTYTLEDFTVSQKATDKKGGYVNKVSTNLKINILEQSAPAAGKKGLGECSMLNDGYVYCTSSSNFNFLTLFGDSYFSSYYYGTDGNSFGTFPGEGGTGTYTMPGQYDPTNAIGSKPALHITENAKINFESDYMAVYGDLVLDKNACLNISKGNLTVYGDIYLLGNSTLICGGHIYQPKSYLPGRKAQCGFRTSTGYADENYLKVHLFYPNGNSKSAPYKAEEVLDKSYTDICKTMNLDNEKKDDDGITRKISVPFKYNDNGNEVKLSMLDYVTNVPKTPKADGSGLEEKYKFSSSYYGKDCGVAFAKGGASVGNIGEYENYIVFVTNGKYASEFNLNGSNVRTTIVASCPVHLNVQSGIYMSKMGSDIYDYLTIKDSSNPYYDEDIHHMELAFSGAKIVDDEGKIIRDPYWTPGNPWWDGAQATNDSRGNYYSAGDFLATDTNTHVQNLFNAGINGGSSEKNYINSVSFVGYVKDKENTN